MALDEWSKVSLTFGAYINQCLKRFNIFRIHLNIYIEKWTFQDFSIINELGIKFGLAVKKIKVNPDSSFEQTW